MMSCSEIDVKGYFLEELAAEEAAGVKEHLRVCTECREEMERLETTHAALLAVREEEIPRRIAFVSDKVFEPNWWQRIWQSAPRLGFASAAMLSVAIFVHAYTRPATVMQETGLDQAAVQEIVEREVAHRLDTAVAQAVATAEQRSHERTEELLQTAAERYEMERRQDRAMVEQAFDYLTKRLNVEHISVARMTEYPEVAR